MLRTNHFYPYLLSLPERVIRSLSALSGGLLQEIGHVALPAGVRRSTLYSVMVEVTLRFMIEEVGQVEGVYPTEGRLAEKFLLRRTASHGIDLLGLLTLHASPIWVLAALADATGSGRRLILELSSALKEEGLLDADVNFETVDQVLGGLERTSQHLTAALNLPPMDIPNLRREWEQLKKELVTIPPSKIPAIDRIERLWAEIKESAKNQKQSVFMVSSLLAISTTAHVPAAMLWLSKAAHSSVRRTGRVLGDAILTHYSDALSEMAKTGFLSYWKREFRPYLEGAARQFSPGHGSLTERWLNREGR